MKTSKPRAYFCYWYRLDGEHRSAIVMARSSDDAYDVILRTQPDVDTENSTVDIDPIPVKDGTVYSLQP